MRVLILAPLFGVGLAFFNGSACAADYYVRSSSGVGVGDGDVGSSANPFKTIAKVNAAALLPGDNVYFRCGDTFSVVAEPLKVKSGVTYANYDCSSTNSSIPKLSGSVKLTGLVWSQYQGNIYKAVIPEGLPVSKIEQLFATPGPWGAEKLQRARHPNVGDGSYDVVNAEEQSASRYYRIGAQSPIKTGAGGVYVMHLDRSQWADAASQSVPFTDANYKDALVYARPYDWTLTAYSINSVIMQNGVDHVSMAAQNQGVVGQDDVGNNVYGLLHGVGGSLDGFKRDNVSPLGGYWMENKLWMLDQAGEWFYDKSSRTIYVWQRSGYQPSSSTTFYAAVADFAITSGMNGRNLSVNDIANDFKIMNLEVRETVLDGISLLGNFDESSANALTKFTLENLVIKRAGRSGVVVRAAYGSAAARPVIKGLTIEDSALNGLSVSQSTESVKAADNSWSYPYLKRSRNIFIKNNTVLRSGVELGGVGIDATGADHWIDGNVVTDAGGRGIDFGLRNTVKNNIVTNACLALDDCGALYTIVYYTDVPFLKDGTNELEDGVVEPPSLNSSVMNNIVSNVPGSVDGRPSAVSQAYGIYLDGHSRAVQVFGNFIENAQAAGVFLHGTWDVDINSNTILASKAGSVALAIGSSGKVPLVMDASNNTVQGNNMLATGRNSLLVIHSRDGLDVDAQYPLHGMVKYTDNRYAATSPMPFQISLPDPAAQFDILENISDRPKLIRQLSFLKWIRQEIGLADSDFSEDGLGVEDAPWPALGNGIYYNLPIYNRVTPNLAIGGDFNGSLGNWGALYFQPATLSVLGVGGCSNYDQFYGLNYEGNWAKLNSHCVSVSPLPYLQSGGIVNFWNERAVGSIHNNSSDINLDVKKGDVYMISFWAKSSAPEVGDFVAPRLVNKNNYEGVTGFGGVSWQVVDQQWDVYNIPLEVMADSVSTRLDLSFATNDTIAFDELQIYKVVPEFGGDNYIYVEKNPTDAARLATCFELGSGPLSHAEFKSLRHRDVAFQCGVTMVPPRGSIVYVWTASEHQDVDWDGVADKFDEVVNMNGYNNFTDQSNGMRGDVRGRAIPRLIL